MTDDVIHPTVIPTTPFPGESSATSQTHSSGDTLTPQVIPDTPLPQKKVADHVVSDTLNTKSRKILGVFEFTPKGAIQIGTFTQGQSGDVRISPLGILGRNKAGETTFALDAETGDATFKGLIESGALITGKVDVGNGRVVIDGTGDGEIIIKDDTDTTIIDAKGLVSTANFNVNSVTNNSSRQMSNGSYADVDNTTITFSLERTARVLIMMNVVANIFMGSDSAGAGASIVLNVNGVNQTSTIFEQDILDSAQDPSLSPLNSSRQWPLNATGTLTLPAGDYTLKLNASVLTAGHQLNILRTSLIYMILGK